MNTYSNGRAHVQNSVLNRAWCVHKSGTPIIIFLIIQNTWAVSHQKKNNVHKGGGEEGKIQGFKINLSLFQRSYFLVLHELQINIQTFLN